MKQLTEMYNHFAKVLKFKINKFPNIVVSYFFKMYFQYYVFHSSITLVGCPYDLTNVNLKKGNMRTIMLCY